jgi:hypothetical protein
MSLTLLDFFSVSQRTKKAEAEEEEEEEAIRMSMS